MTTQDHTAALKDLRLGVEMDRHNLDDGDAKLAALDAAIAALSTPPAPAEPQAIGYVDPLFIGCRRRGMPLNSKIYAQPNGEHTAPVYASPPPQQPAQGEDAVPTCNIGRANFTPFYLLANCRRICADEYATKPNWVIAMELFALGSTSAMKVCRDAGIDPDGFEVRPVSMSAAQDEEPEEVKCPGCGERGEPNGKDGEYRCGSGLSGGCTR